MPSATADAAVPCASRTDARLKGAWCHQLSAADCASHWARQAGGQQRRFACGVSNGACRRGPPCSDRPVQPSIAAAAGRSGNVNISGACEDAPGWRNFWQLDCAANRLLAWADASLFHHSTGGMLRSSGIVSAKRVPKHTHRQVATSTVSQPKKYRGKSNHSLHSSVTIGIKHTSRYASRREKLELLLRS